MVLETIIVLAFRIINTGAVIGVVYYLYQKYGRSIITNKIQQEYQEQSDRAHHVQVLAIQEQDITQLMEREREFFNGMRDRVVIWKKHVDHHAQRTHHDAQVREIYLKERYAKRAAYLRDLHIHRQVIPQVIAQVQSALITRFEVEDQAQKMTKTVVAFMRSTEQ